MLQNRFQVSNTWHQSQMMWDHTLEEQELERVQRNLTRMLPALTNLLMREIESAWLVFFGIKEVEGWSHMVYKIIRGIDRVMVRTFFLWYEFHWVDECRFKMRGRSFKEDLNCFFLHTWWMSRKRCQRTWWNQLQLLYLRDFWTNI